MYIRFAQLERAPEVRVAPGVFQAFHRLPPFDRTDWRHREIRRVYEGFNDNLACPEVRLARMSRYGLRHGVCWFRDAAHSHVSEARYLAWLLSEVGVPIRELRSPDPGVLIWEDDDQIVVVPERRALVQVH